MPTATFLPDRSSLASRLDRKSYSRQDCTAALRGTSLPQNLGNEVVRLALVAGLRKHLHLAQDPQVEKLCSHDAEQAAMFARARIARLIMSNIMVLDNQMKDDCQPYCIWHPDVASEETYRELVQRHPEMNYQVARACAVAGYFNLYSKLDVLPDVSIAEEARENQSSDGARKIYESIMNAPARYRVMDDYTLVINPSARPGAQLNADTALVSSLKETRKSSAEFEPGWRPFNITEDWGISEKSVSNEPPTLTTEETSLIDSPLPFDLPTPNKNLLILMAAYSGNLDRYARLRRPRRIPGEWHCLLRGIYHSTFLATWLARPENRHVLSAVGVHERDVQALWRAIHARRVMNNDIQHVLERRGDGWAVSDQELPYWIWYPTLPQETTLIRLATTRPVMAPQCVRACIAADYRGAYLEIMDGKDAPRVDELMLYEAKQCGRETFYEEDLERRREAAGTAPLPWDPTAEWKECVPWRNGELSSTELLGWLRDCREAVHSGQDGGMWENNGLETGRIELWVSSPEWVRERARKAQGGVLEVKTVPTGGKEFATGKFA